MAWPNPEGDWGPILSAVHITYRAIISAIRTRAPVLLVVNDITELIPLSHAFAGEQAEHPIQLTHFPFDDTWVRDTGPITVMGPGGPEWLDFRFDGWNGRDRFDLDDRLVAELLASDALPRLSCHRFEQVLEGGAIDCDGQGSLLATWRCLSRSFPGKSRSTIEQELAASLGTDLVLWLEHGELIGDETDGHVDMLARFASPDTIVYQGCDRQDDIHFEKLGDLRAELESLHNRRGDPFRLVELPLPEPMHGLDGKRLPASYANFPVLNKSVLVPVYQDPSDQYALQMIGMAFPGRDIMGIDCRTLIQQGGGLHCATMQLPVGVWK
jgi:agmatine/peptidylarginine deiminase